MSTTHEKPAKVETEAIPATQPLPEEDPGNSEQPPSTTLKGWRLAVTLIAVFVGLFLAMLDTTIVAVALPTIANQFSDFDHSTWVINAYLLTNMAFSIVTSRLSDIFGRKTVECTAFTLFIAFSLGCALSKSMTQLIIFRALQGVGGSGLYTMCMVTAISLVPRGRSGIIVAAISTCIIIAGVLGPVLGGAITHNSTSDTWPWIFWMNLPIGGLALIALIVAWPTHEHQQSRFSWKSVKSVDFLGSLLLLAASALLVFALEEAGSYQYAWNSATIICCLVFSGICFIAFPAWQYWITVHPAWPVQVVFPVKLMTHRVILCAIGSMLLSGFTYYIAIVTIPERSQIVSGQSPISAGVRLLPLLMLSAVGSIIGGAVSSKGNFTAPTLVVAGAFQLLGYGLMTTLGDSRSIPAKQYGFEVFLGLGFGLSMSSVTQMVTLIVDPEWLAVLQGTLSQMRTLGGSIGLAVAVIIFDHRVRTDPALVAATTPAERSALFRSPLVIETFTPTQQLLVSRVFSSAFTQQMQVATYIAAASFVVSLGTLQRHPPPISDFRHGQMTAEE